MQILFLGQRIVLTDNNDNISWDFKHPALIPLNSRSGD